MTAGAPVWSDGQQLVSGDARWADNEPNNNNFREHCVLLEEKTWKDWNCEEEKVFTCEKMPQRFFVFCTKDAFYISIVVCLKQSD